MDTKLTIKLDEHIIESAKNMQKKETLACLSWLPITLIKYLWRQWWKKR